MRRFVIAQFVLAIGLFPSGTSHASSWKTYHNTALGFSVSYPGDWQPFKAAGTNIAVETADSGAVFDGLASPDPTSPSDSDLHNVVDSILTSAGVPSSSKITIKTQVVHGVTFVVGSGTDARANGQKVSFSTYVTYTNKTAYAFVTGLVVSTNGVARVQALGQRKALDTIVASIRIAKPSKP